MAIINPGLGRIPYTCSFPMNMGLGKRGGVLLDTELRSIQEHRSGYARGSKTEFKYGNNPRQGTIDPNYGYKA